MRRALAIAAALALSAVAWSLFADDDASEEPTAAKRPAGVSPPSAALVESLTAEERVDQVLLLGFDGADAPAPIVAELGERQLGGVLVESGNWLDATAGTALIGELTAAGRSGGRVPPLIVGTQEGGVYRSYLDLPPVERQLDIGDRGSPERAQQWALETAEALRAAGFHLNLFPVADVATLDSPLADRAFSDDPAMAAALTAATLRGCREAGLACAPLHFPGLGAASQDTAEGPATVSLDLTTLASRDFEPFRAAVSESAPAMVLSLAFYAAYDPVTPAALTPALATEALRDDVAFRGVAITDDLSSGAVKATYRVPEAAVAALAAGADLVQISNPADQERVREAALKALESGELPPERLAEAAGRVLELKRTLGLIPDG